MKITRKLREDFSSENILVDSMVHVDCKKCSAFVDFYFCKNAHVQWRRNKEEMGQNTRVPFEKLRENMKKSFRKFKILSITWPVEGGQTRVRFGGVVYSQTRAMVWDGALVKKMSEKYRHLTYNLQKHVCYPPRISPVH
ncbi:hypothetical protein P879_05990 [Paragonimus westermani]|uniref:Uncharacterized protein n=1 Tax=Paragonimus westermani TaxID=34504 RepID=A0A8T0DTF2_9TREM|nr:hypothetical protein P879_05990 [Paragonimus westermani]